MPWLGVAGGGDQASGLNAALSFHGVEADEVQGNVLECGEIVGVVESDVHAPV